ncbi:hypothetical protein DL767_000192 [Monosporascus sp. MG133]|nr:hypothetical protein DL767_000192 [Monosporascus sp. MG133]
MASRSKRERLKGLLPWRLSKAQPGAASTTIATLADDAVVLPLPSGDKHNTVEKTAETPSASEHTISTPPPSVEQSTVRLSTDIPEPFPSLWSQALQKLSAKERNAIEPFVPQQGESTADILDQIKGEVKTQMNAHEGKKWTVHFAGRTVVLRDKVQKLVTWLDKFKAIGDVVASYDPAHMALPWAGIRFLIQATAAQGKQMEDLLVCLETITYLINRFRIYEILYLGTEQPQAQARDNLTEAVVAAYAAILRFLASAANGYQDGVAARALRATFSPDGVSDLLAECQKWALEANVEADNCERTRSEVVRADLIEVKSLLESMQKVSEGKLTDLWDRSELAERVCMLQWMSTIPFEDMHNQAKDGRTHDTGLWLLAHEQFKKWRLEGASMTLWVHGPPGYGKTKLMSTVVDDLLAELEDDEALAYFYCDRNQSDRRGPEPILRSCIRQLATSRRDDGVIHCSLRRLYQKYKTSAFARQHISTEVIKRELISLTSTFRITTIVIDALDECYLDTRSNLIEALAEIAAESARPVKVLMSARPDGDLRYYMSSEASIDLTLVDTRDDISKFVIESVYGRPKDAPNLRYWREQITDKLRQAVCEVLIEKSRGMFQWAKLQIAQLRKLQSERDIRRRLGQLPEKLQDIYHEIWTEIQIQEGDKPVIAQRAFQILFSAFTPMSPPELIIAVCQDPDTDYVQVPYLDMDYILDACQNLLLVDQHEYACRLSHLSVYEYFQAHELGIGSSHSMMAEMCLLFVMETAIEGFPMSGIDRLFTEPEIDDVLEVVSEGIDESHMGLWSLLRYAYRHWPLHAQACFEEDGPCSGLGIRLTRFLGPNYEGSPAYDGWLSKFQYSWGYSLTTQRRSYTPTGPPKYLMAFFGFNGIFPCWWEPGYSDINERDPKGRTMLMLACWGGSLSVVESLLKAGADINPVHDVLGTALILAVDTNNYGIAKLLLERGADPNLASNPQSALDTAVTVHNNFPIIEALIKHGATIGRFHPLYAVKSGNEEMVALFMQHDDLFEPEYRKDKQYSASGYALRAAVEIADETMVRLLVDLGADIRRTPCLVDVLKEKEMIIRKKGFLQTTAGQNSMLNFLLRLGADPSAKEPPFGDALMTAVHLGNEGAARLILESAPSLIEIKDDRSLLPVAVFKRNIKMVELLLNYGADINAPGGLWEYGGELWIYGLNPVEWGRTREYGTPLVEATRVLAVDVVALLLSRGGQVNGGCGELRRSPLMSVIEVARQAVRSLWKEGAGQVIERAVQIASMLMDNGADVNALGGEHGSALATAAASGHMILVKILLEHGAHIQIQDGEMDVNALISAVEGSRECRDERSYEAIVQLLLERGADVNALGGVYGNALAAATQWTYEQDRSCIWEGPGRFDMSGVWELPDNEEDVAAEQARGAMYLKRGERIAEMLRGHGARIADALTVERGPRERWTS